MCLASLFYRFTCNKSCSNTQHICLFSHTGSWETCSNNNKRFALILLHCGNSEHTGEIVSLDRMHTLRKVVYTSSKRRWKWCWSLPRQKKGYLGKRTGQGLFKMAQSPRWFIVYHLSVNQLGSQATSQLISPGRQALG